MFTDIFKIYINTTIAFHMLSQFIEHLLPVEKMYDKFTEQLKLDNHTGGKWFIQVTKRHNKWVSKLNPQLVI